MPVTEKQAQIGVGIGLVVFPEPATTKLGLILIGSAFLPDGTDGYD